jgi:hypothetical protein
MLYSGIPYSGIWNLVMIHCVILHHLKLEDLTLSSTFVQKFKKQLIGLFYIFMTEWLGSMLLFFPTRWCPKSISLTVWPAKNPHIWLCKNIVCKD